MMELLLSDELGKITVEIDEADNPLAVIIMAHGAGAGMHHPFMVELSKKLADQNVNSVRFNFPYMEQGRKSPGSPKKNIETWELVVKHINGLFPKLPIFASGKSYGGRMASHMLSSSSVTSVRGIIYYGFPLHAPGKDSKDRADHLGDIDVPQLFIQGSNDKLASIELIKEVISGLKLATLVEIDRADHSFNVPKSIGKTRSEIIEELVGSSLSFIKKVTK